MTGTAEIAAIASVDEVRSHVRRAGGGNPTIYRENGEDVAVLIPATAFRAVQGFIKLAWTEFPVNCWDDPVTMILSSVSQPCQEKQINYSQQPGRLPAAKS